MDDLGVPLFSPQGLFATLLCVMTILSIGLLVWASQINVCRGLPWLRQCMVLRLVMFWSVKVQREYAKTGLEFHSLPGFWSFNMWMICWSYLFKSFKTTRERYLFDFFFRGFALHVRKLPPVFLFPPHFAGSGHVFHETVWNLGPS